MPQKKVGSSKVKLLIKISLIAIATGCGVGAFISIGLVPSTKICSFNGASCPLVISKAVAQTAHQSFVTTTIPSEIKNEYGSVSITRQFPERIVFEITTENPTEYISQAASVTTVFSDQDALGSLKKELVANNISITEFEEIDAITLRGEYQPKTNDDLPVERELTILFDATDLETSLYKLEYILAHTALIEEFENVVEIDLRFKLPVLRTERTNLTQNQQ